MDKKNRSIPKWCKRFLRAICPNEFYEEIEGDLNQQFNKNVNTFGYRKSSIKLFITVLRFFRPGILFRKKLLAGHNRIDLFRNDLQLTFRQLRRNSLFSILNITGLSASIAVVLMIAQYAGFHFSFDKHHEITANKFRVISNTYEGNSLSFESALTNYKVAPLLGKEFPEIDSYTQLMPTDSWFDCALRFDSKRGPVIYNERKLFFTDSQFLQFFSAQIIVGNLKNALHNPFSIVLTKSAANRYFNGDNPLGKVLHLKGSFEENDYEVTAVIEDFPSNTHLDIDVLVSLSSLEKNQGVGNNDFYTYVILKENVDALSLDNKVLSLSKRLSLGEKQQVEYRLQALTDIHLRSDLQDEMTEGADLDVIYFLIVIGVVIIGIAWINYVNLSMSQIFERARQVGIRKVNGATRMRIVGQFFTEAVVINLLSISIAMMLIELATPMFRDLTGISFAWREFIEVSWHNPAVYVFLLLGTGIFLSAIYPSGVMASFNPVHVLKGKIQTMDRRSIAGNALITFQFTCSIVLLITVFVIHSQYSFMQNKNPGLEIDNTLIVKAPAHIDSTYRNRFAALRNYAAANLHVKNISTSTSVPGEDIEWTGRVRNPLSESARNVHIHVADTAYFRTYHIPLLIGRDFIVSDYPGEKFGTKTEQVILNKKAVEVLGFASEVDALGRTIYWGDNKCTVIGVVANYHQQSLRSEFKPTLYTANSGPLMSLKLDEGFEKDFHYSIGQLEDAWKKFFPDNPFDFFYLPDFYQSHYKSENNMRTVTDIFSSVALITSCLGLLGLAAFAAKQKTKEVSIRKILGADWIGIVMLLSRKFIANIFVSVLIAVPIALMQCAHWLGRYAFHIELQIWHFAIPVAVVAVISLFTILSQCWKVVTNTSIGLLRNE